MGNISEIMHSTHHSKGSFIIKISKDLYIDIRTGEVKRFKHTETRAQNLSSVAKSLQSGRDLINTNVTYVSKCRWLTLTYAKNIQDPNKLYNDFKNFNRRCRQIFRHYEYITCAEPQGRGAWHLHAILIFESKAPFMENSVVADCWKQGFVTVKSLDNIDDVGAYLTAYLGDVELSEALELNLYIKNKKIKIVESIDDDGIKQTKRYVKNARLQMYPTGFHIFRHSKGIKQPTVSHVPYKRAKEKVSSSKLTFSQSIELEDIESDFKFTITHEYYNSIRH